MSVADLVGMAILQSQSNKSMRPVNQQIFLRPQPDQLNNEEEPHSQLSYSTLAKQIDDEEEMISQQQAQQEQPKNISLTNKNTHLFNQPFLNVDKFKAYGSQHAGFRLAPQLPQAMQIQSPSAMLSEAGRVSLHSYGSNPLSVGSPQISSGFGQHVTLSQRQFLSKPDQNRSFKPKVLGERIVNSMIMKQSRKNDSIGTIEEQSLVLAESDQDESIQHFAAASYDSSDESQPNQDIQQNGSQNNILITVTQSKVNNNQLFEHQLHSKIAQMAREGDQPIPLPSELLQLNTLPQVTSQQKYNQTHNQPPHYSNQHQLEQHTQKLCKMTKSKVIVPETAQKDIPIDNQRQQSVQKKISKVEVPNRMKSTYDPVNRKSEYKLANGGNLSQPGKRESKVEIKKVEEPELSDETQSEAMKYQKQKYQKAVMAGLQNIEKDIAFITENQQLTQQLEEEYKRPTTRKIEIMKKLAPEELFNGFSSVQTNERDRRQHDGKHKNSEYSSILLQQIQNLKKKINYLERVSSSRRDIQREDRRLQGVNSDRNSSSRHKRISINYKDYNQTSHAKVLKKKSLSLRKDISSDMSINEDEFTELQMLASMLKILPKAHNTPQQLVKLSLQVLDNFGIQLSRFASIDVTKFKEGVQFQIKEDLTLIWYYDGELYLGETTNRRQGFAQLQGEGLFIQPNYSCYKGSFSKDKKCGFGLLWNAKGQKYKGQWKNDLFHGKGKLVNEISEYDGHFARGLKEGLGYELFTDGDSYQGEYESGKFNGRGKYVWKNKTQYMGDFKMGFMEGEGVWKSKKDSYEGQYYKNMKHGYGIYRWGNGRVYEGKFQHGHRATKKTRNKPTISVQKEITYDLDMDNNNESELYECKVDNELRTGKRRFTIESIVDGAKERKGSKFTVLKK